MNGIKVKKKKKKKIEEKEISSISGSVEYMIS